MGGEMDVKPPEGAGGREAPPDTAKPPGAGGDGVGGTWDPRPRGGGCARAAIPTGECEQKGADNG